MTDSPNAPRRVEPRRWTTLTLAGTAVGLAVAGTGHAAGFDPVDMTGPETLWLAQSEGGEAGESGAAADAEPEVALLARLGLIEGHLRTSQALYQAGDADMAATHAAHPRAEVYEEIEHELEEIGADQFEAELEALSEAIEGGKDSTAVGDAYDMVFARIDAARGAAKASDKEALEALVRLVRTAGDEYDHGVKDGAVDELPEYQDAWGFIQAARRQAEALAASDNETVAGVGAVAIAELDGLADALPGVQPEGGIKGDTGMLLAAAAKIELAAYKVK
ncbi:MAG: hypothetical protein R3E44_05020 [Paracoccaceae bacterium]